MSKKRSDRKKKETFTYLPSTRDSRMHKIRIITLVIWIIGILYILWRWGNL
ncbi:MAG: hypothetical protein PHG91_10560 [Syntrophales bacterium]|nr:hypothetical protein [Syntrophales bacterium]MDD5233823.1 hypothetical protein [Syntrophales bacterium]MDD5532010.1 hypothetical protein [Syntrophales bacterium]